MTDPVTSAIVVGLNAVGTIAQGNAAARQAKYQAAQYRQQAERARQEAAAQASQIRRQRSREQSHLRARLAASGVDPASGSPLLSLETLAGDAELEALTAVNQGAARAAGLEANAGYSLLRGRAARDQKYLSAGTYLLENRKAFDPETLFPASAAKPSGPGVVSLPLV